MRKSLYLSLLLILGCLCQAKAVNYQALEVEISMNPSEYRHLLDRFIKADTTLTPDEISKVYYGFSLSPSYEPRDSFPEIREAYNRQDLAEVERLIQPALELNPVSLDLIYMGLTAYENGFGTTPGAKALNLAIRFEQLVTAIVESGRGTFAQSPFYVISNADRDRVLKSVIVVGNILGRDTVGDVEAVKFVFPGKTRMHILYFDNTPERKFLAQPPR